MNTVTQIDNTEFRYALLQVSSGRFGASFNTLNNEQRAEAEKIARFGMPGGYTITLDFMDVKPF